MKHLKILFALLLCIPLSVKAVENTNIGVVQAFSGVSIPEDYLLADGSAISRETYKELYAIIGTTYGVGNGSTTFNLPNFSGRILVGKSSDTEFNDLGKKGGEKSHQLTTSEIPSHTHTFTGYGHSHTYTDTSSTSTSNTVIPTASFTGKQVNSSSSGAHTHTTRYKYMTTSNYGAPGGSNPFITTGTAASTNSTSSAGSHSHTLTAAGTVSISNTAHTHTATDTGTLGDTTSTGTNSNTGGNQAHNNLQPYMVMKYIIKVK